MSKFMQSLGDSAYIRLRKIAEERDITVQELIRAIVIPDWLKMTDMHADLDGQSSQHRRRVSRSSQRSSALAVAVASKPKRK